MRLHCLNVVDAAARAPTRLVREWRSFRDGVVPTQDLPCFTPGTENFFVTDIRKNKGIQCRFGMRGVIAEAFSSDVITPGVTTTDDVRWWLRQRFQSLGLPVWFHPICDVQRRTDDRDDARTFFGDSDATIHRGDVLHCDVGIRYLRLCTDTQEMGYVLRVGEEDVPDGLRAAMATGNRWQDLLTGSFVAGRTGNEILEATRAAADAEGITCSVYTHPLGFHGHAAGPTIGMWDNQGRTPIRGDWKLYANTCYAIEGNVTVRVPEWNDQPVQIKLEQDAWFDGEAVHYIGGRQTSWHLVR